MRHSRSFKRKNISLENQTEEGFEFTQEELEELSLLNSSLISTYLFTISDIIFYDSTVNSINYILNKQRDERLIGEVEAIEAGYLEVISKIILVNVDISRYSHLYKKNINDNAMEILEQVAMLTPENIHLNSFMFEPILDMSLLHLYDLYQEVKNLLIKNAVITP